MSRWRRDTKKNIYEENLSIAYTNANLMMAGFHDPKRFPKFSEIIGEKKEEISSKEHQEMANDLMAALKGYKK